MQLRVPVLALLVVCALGAEVEDPAATAAAPEAAPASAPAPVGREALQAEAQWLQAVRSAESTAARAAAQDQAQRRLADEAAVVAERSRPSWWLLILALGAPLLWIGIRRVMTRPPAPAPQEGTQRVAYSEQGTGYFVLNRAEPGTGSGGRPATGRTAGTGSGGRPAAGAGTASGARRPATDVLRREPELEPTGEGSGARKPTTVLTRRPPRDGFTLLEVMIVVAILTTGLAFMIGQVYTLNKAQQATRQLARVQELTQVMAERLQGAAWIRLGTSGEPWSWHRRDDAAALNPPLTETAMLSDGVTPDPNHNLIALGLLDTRSGLDNLRVHVEYYRNTVLQGVDSRRTWDTSRTNPFHQMAQDPVQFDLRNVLNDIIIRVVVRWNSSSGGQQQHELVLSRRQ